jgi:mitochondrial fission protein ELM1
MASCWIITEKALTGTENQCRGIAAALGITPTVKHIGLRQPWRALSPWMGFECACTFTGDSLKTPWPDIVIAAGRKAVAAARYIKKRNPATFTVFVQNPRISPRHFDLVAAPAHDGLRGNNVFITDAAPNMITPALLAEAKAKFAPLLEPLPVPRVAVLVGGNSKTHRLTPEIMERLAARLKALEAEGYGLMVTASRRTPPKCKKILQNEIGQNCIFWDGTDENPYHGFLAWADYIIVTEDSASMISEAATTGKPVYTVPLEGGSPRFDLLYNRLRDKGIIRNFEGKPEPYGYTALNDAAMVAEEIRRRMKTG